MPMPSGYAACPVQMGAAPDGLHGFQGPLHRREIGDVTFNDIAAGDSQILHTREVRFHMDCHVPEGRPEFRSTLVNA